MKLKTIFRKAQRWEYNLIDGKEPEPRNRLSFYGKAKEYEIKVGGKLYSVLKSYDTIVCIREKKFNGDFYFGSKYSTTTLRHIKSFLGTDRTLKQLRKEMSKND